MLFGTIALLTGSLSCEKDENTGPALPEITEEMHGQEGDPRFNLRFTNSENANLDIHVQTPDGTDIYQGNRSGQGGELDLDCLCSEFPTSPSENVYWQPGTATAGTYKIWVEYFDSCTGTKAPSNFTLRVMTNGNTVKKYSGTLSRKGQKSVVYSFTL
jgi:uncharacterized protein YfaP (DUF2135 family)